MTYLHKEELRKISGATQRRRLIPWLQSLNVPFFPDADGWPIVKEWLSGKSCGNRANEQHPENGFSCGK